MLSPEHIIKQPLITEKSTWEGQVRNRYSFHVDMSARKEQIRYAIEKLYNVRVEKISTQIRKGRSYRTRFGVSTVADWKKATVQVHPEDKIDLF